ncbi:MAG: hypothetical protein VYA44_06840 [SAR324 cluster bacterium]|jgi:hypothetical protein|nr:hypothetical protein [SAR324 cluster bacterium]MEC8939583.1 hypothetical protein [SAR324 cluster bacterium]MEC9012029.1 hypothetical protein [SAR324 cluster bacterium]MEC9383404.1 hypothetical protein [SAR324 cluster bacterium]MED5402917.1 hypothetical protein [SAR324 cluster bacterium]|tara:strand:- start:188 stop:445 length:258 start_codon:yes stop_codon:yes gene_type:complete
MESKTKIVASCVSHDDVTSAMERFFGQGGKITKIENNCQEILLKQDMDDEDMNFIDPHAANPASNGLGEVGNILQQEVQTVHKEA